MSGLRFDNVTKQFGDFTALDQLDLDIEKGEFVALVGSSGCGKTTSLRILAGLEEATSGRVFVTGRDVTGLPARDRNLAMVFQSYALYPHMTAAENIGFTLELAGVRKAEREDRVRRAADRLRIGHLLHRRPKELSGGQRQRVALARCIVREPDAFLFDEPLSNLDASLRVTARAEIRKLQKSLGITSLYVTHDQVEAMTMADRIVLMDSGRLRQVGTPMELYHHPRDLFVASFLGSPPINAIQGRVEAFGDTQSFISQGLEVSLPRHFRCPPGPATLGIRPEALHLPRGADDARVKIAGTITYIEKLGAEMLLEFLPSGGEGPTLIARLGGTHAMETGDSVQFSVDPSGVHLFDADGNSTRANA